MEEIEITIENRLKEMRKGRDLSQEDLAEALGISRQSIISLEQGRSMPSLPLAVQLCRYFNTAFEEMFEFEREIEEIHNALNEKTDKLNLSNSGENTGGKEHAMVEIERWRPAREAVSLRDAMDRLFEDSFITSGKMGGMPKIDIVDRKDEVRVKAELPGVDEADVDVEIADNVMTISGEIKEEKEEKEKGYYYQERQTGAFSRSFTLPSEVDADKAVAEMKSGILTITVPKVEAKKAQKIAIKKQ